MKYLKVLLLALFAVQLAVPGYMIFEQHQILSKGTVYKFKTQPIDPYDPFRGRYVTLNYEVNNTLTQSEKALSRDDWVYALLDKDDNGFVTFSKLVTEKPASKDYIELQVGWGSAERGYRVQLPFNRYYASEDNAPKIEKAVWGRETVDDVYAEISVLDGKATIKELYIEGLPVKEYLEQKATQADK